MSRIKTIIFDIGRVLVDFEPEAHFKKFAKNDEILQKMMKATVYAESWNEFDKGVWSLEQIVDSFVENDRSIEKELRACFQDVKGIIIQREYAIPWIKQLKKEGYQVLVLSNFPEKTYEDCKEEMSFLDETDGGILSYRDRVIKPDEAIYKLLMERYDLKAEECVFLDDVEKNLVTARQLGMKTILFQNKEQAEKELISICAQ